MDRLIPRDQDRLAPHRHLSAPAPTERGLAVLVLVSLLAVAGLALWARFINPAPFEVAILQAADLPAGAARDAVGVVNSLGNLPVWAALIAATSIAVGYVRGAIVALAVALTFAADLAAFGVKLLVGRQRPETAATEHFFGVDSFAFPSGHVVRAVALAAVLIWLFAPPERRVRLALAGAVGAGLLMGFARVSLGVHWPTDALGGFALGLAWFALTALLLSRVGRNENAKQEAPAP